MEINKHNIDNVKKELTELIITNLKENKQDITKMDEEQIREAVNHQCEEVLIYYDDQDEISKAYDTWDRDVAPNKAFYEAHLLLTEDLYQIVQEQVKQLETNSQQETEEEQEL